MDRCCLWDKLQVILFSIFILSVISCPTWQLYLVCMTTVAKCKTKFIFYVKNTRVSLRMWCLEDRYPVLRLQVLLFDFMLEGRMFHWSVYKFQLYVQKGTFIPIFSISVQNTDSTPFSAMEEHSSYFLNLFLALHITLNSSVSALCSPLWSSYAPLLSFFYYLALIGLADGQCTWGRPRNTLVEML